MLVERSLNLVSSDVLGMVALLFKRVEWKKITNLRILSLNVFFKHYLFFLISCLLPTRTELDEDRSLDGNNDLTIRRTPAVLGRKGDISEEEAS